LVKRVAKYFLVELTKMFLPSQIFTLKEQKMEQLEEREREKKLLEEQGEEENVFVCIVDVGGTLCCCEGHFNDLHKCRNTPFNISTS